MSRDLWAAALSALYVLCILGLAEWFRRRGMPQSSTRKIVHVGVGCWIVPTFLLFENKWWAVAPALGFVLVNALSFRLHLIRSVEGERRNLGTILFPLSVALLLIWTFGSDRAPYGAAGILAMTFGDAAASLIGRRFGRHGYRIAGHPRSLEGSLAMAGFSFVAICLGLLCFGVELNGPQLRNVAVAAAVATGLEAISLFGFDNLWVPLGTTATLVWLGAA